MHSSSSNIPHRRFGVTSAYNNYGPIDNRIGFLKYSIMMVCVFLCIIYQIAPVQGDCVMTSNGYYNMSWPPNYPTIPWTTPYTLDDTHMQTLTKICPHLNGQTVCCNASQVDTLKTNFLKIDLTFWHCPACVLSQKQMWCDFTCSNRQDEFVTINSMNPKDEKYIGVVNFYASETFQSGLWESCKDDKFAQVPVKSMYPDVQSFLQGMIEISKPNPFIDFVFQKSNMMERVKFNKPLNLTKDTSLIVNSYDYTIERHEDIRERKHIVDTISKLKLTETHKADALSYYNATAFPCEAYCECAYCEKVCQSITPDYSCKMFGAPCYVIVSIGGSVMLGLFLIAFITAIFEKGWNWAMNRKNAGQTYQSL